MKLPIMLFRILGSGIIVFSLQAYALTPAQELVEKMSISAKTLSYKGYFSYERGQQSASYKIIHWVSGDIEKQRLVFLDGKPSEIINDGHSLQCIHAGDVHTPGEETAIHANPVDVLPASLDSVWENYQVEITGSTRIADRNVTRIYLNPKDNNRYAFVFFVDDESGLMLKMVILNSQGQALERFHFVMVEYNNVSESDLIPQIKDFRVVNHAVDSINDNRPSKNAWDLTWIPKGFREEKAQMNDVRGSLEGRQVYMFSDGLSAFSVFAEPFAGIVPGDTSTQMGSTSAVSHYAQFAGKMFLVTVVGEIPIMTAKQIALSMRPSS